MIRCPYCRKPVDPESNATLRGVHAWEKRVRTRWTGTKGGSDLRLREPLNEYAHERCVDLERAGVNAEQQTLV